MPIENIESGVNFNELREEIKTLKSAEEAATDEHGRRLVGHFEAIDVGELVEDDLLAYKNLKSRKFTLGNFMELKDKVIKSGNPSRQEFFAFLSNKFQAQIGEDDLRRI